MKKKVDKNAFNSFINNYPKKLERDVYGVCEPPLITYNDFSKGDWPESIVASTYLYENEPESYWYVPEEERIYCIHEVDN